jgi:RNA polymerase sigma-70 factor, ECF subfamily
VVILGIKSALQRARGRLEELALTDGQIMEPAAPAARELLDQYIAAFENADAAALERLLLTDATLAATPLRRWFAGRSVRIPFLRRHLLGSPGDWRMLPTSANGQPAAAAYTRDRHGSYQAYGICVLTVSGAGIHRITSFGDPTWWPRSASRRTCRRHSALSRQQFRQSDSFTGLAGSSWV